MLGGEGEESSIRRTRPRTGEDCGADGGLGGGGVSRMQTAAPAGF